MLEAETKLNFLEKKFATLKFNCVFHMSFGDQKVCLMFLLVFKVFSQFNLEESIMEIRNSKSGKWWKHDVLICVIVFSIEVRIKDLIIHECCKMTCNPHCLCRYSLWTSIREGIERLPSRRLKLSDLQVYVDPVDATQELTGYFLEDPLSNKNAWKIEVIHLNKGLYYF